MAAFEEALGIVRGSSMKTSAQYSYASKKNIRNYHVKERTQNREQYFLAASSIVHLVLAYCGKILLSGLENNTREWEKYKSRYKDSLLTQFEQRFFRLEKQCLRRDVTDIQKYHY